MRFHSRDLMVTVGPEVHLMPAPPTPCGCTATAPAPACPFPSLADLVTDRVARGTGCGPCTASPAPECPFPSLSPMDSWRGDGLSSLRSQLRAALTTS